MRDRSHHIHAKDRSTRGYAARARGCTEEQGRIGWIHEAAAWLTFAANFEGVSFLDSAAPTSPLNDRLQTFRRTAPGRTHSICRRRSDSAESPDHSIRRRRWKRAGHLA